MIGPGYRGSAGWYLFRLGVSLVFVGVFAGALASGAIGGLDAIVAGFLMGGTLAVILLGTLL